MNSILSTLFSFVSIISPCIVFGTCCFFLIKKSSAEAILMTIGSGISLLMTILYSVWPLIISAQHLAYTEVSQYYAIFGVISFISSVCFAAGFLILIIKTVKNQVVVHNQFPKSTDYNHE